jgi:ribosomal protein S25
MRAIVLGAVVAVLILSSGCDISFTGTQGSGVAATQNRTIDDFDAISVSGFGNVNVVVGEGKSVIVTVDDNLIDMVRTEVDGSELKIFTSGSIRSNLGLDVQVTVPVLDRVEVSGVANLTATNVIGKAMKVSVSGVGGATINGEVDELDLTI